jgi:hypothetical protein
MLAAVAAAPGAGAVAAAAASGVQLVPGAWLKSVACPSATTCEAVGYDYASDVGIVVTITNGTPGAVQLVAHTTTIASVACPTVTVCEAVGTDDSFHSVVIPITNGTPGASQVVTGSLSAVACFDASTCEAVGSAEVVAITDGVAAAPQAVPGAPAL